MSCVKNFCYNIGDQLQAIKEQYETHCWNKECNNVLLPKEREVLMQYILCEYLDVRTMELARCFIQNVLRSKKDKTVKQFALIPHQQISGRVNPERNMLTQIKQCETLGMENAISQAKFMGAVGTQLKCDTSSFNMQTIKKIILDSNWRFKSNFNSAQQNAMDDLIRVFHSYIVGARCANRIRIWSPNILYTYGLYATQCPKTLKRNFCTLSEKMTVVSKESNIREMILSGKMTPELFLSLLGQLAFTLEMMQQKQGFVHGNMHPDNIMLRPVFNQAGSGITWSYILYGKEYKMRGIQFLATMKNFTQSGFDMNLIETGNIEPQDSFVSAGVQDFLVPGKDICCFMECVRTVLLKTLDPTDSKHFLVDAFGQQNNVNLLRFVEFVLQELFRVPENFFQKTTTNIPNTEVQRHNVMVCQGAGLSPLGLIEALEKQGEKVKGLLGVSKLPWVKEDRQSFVPPVCKKKIPSFLSDLMPNWKSIIEEKSFFAPLQPLQPQEVGTILETLIDLDQNKKMIPELDFRPVMTVENQPMEDNLEYYQKNIIRPDGYFHGAMKNTFLFYNTLNRFLDNYYYAYYIQDEALMTEFSRQNNRITFLMRSVLKTGFVSNIANIVRFLQMIVSYITGLEKKNCCIATKQTLGSMAQQGILQQQKTPGQQQLTRQDIYKIRQQEQPCGPKTKLQSYPLQQQQKRRQQQQKSRQTIGQVRFSQSLPPATQRRSQQYAISQQQAAAMAAASGMTPQQQARLRQQQAARMAAAGMTPQQQARLRQQQAARMAAAGGMTPQQQARLRQQQAARMAAAGGMVGMTPHQQARLRQQQAARMAAAGGMTTQQQARIAAAGGQKKQGGSFWDYLPF